MSETLVSVFAQNKERADLIARKYGVDTRRAYSTRNPCSFEGFRAHIALVDSEAEIPVESMHTIQCSLLKMPVGGQIVYVTA